MRVLPVTTLLLLALALTSPVQGQTMQTAPFVVGSNKSYCHVDDAADAVWMNTNETDGDEAPHEIFGASDVQVPVVGIGADPVANEAFEVRIPLMPGLSQNLAIGGTVTVQAYIGGGAFSAGSANIATSLAAGGTELGAAEAKMHQMTPKNTNAPQVGVTYDPISWTFDVADVTVAAGTTLEWVIEGTVTGNNVFISCFEARGRSYIDIPVLAATGGNASENSMDERVERELPTAPLPLILVAFIALALVRRRL